ncbi:hypothetical protein XH80_16000 [Bradyrhizobium sp. CCBAU 45384]|nr:hypothetical protein [Bradyrhizobium sp. CCBAU 45384]
MRIAAIPLGFSSDRTDSAFSAFTVAASAGLRSRPWAADETTKPARQVLRRKGLGHRGLLQRQNEYLKREIGPRAPSGRPGLISFRLTIARRAT